MKPINIILFITIFFPLFSCDFLEPDLEKQLDVEEVFSRRRSTERYLAHVYAFLPTDFYAVADHFDSKFAGSAERLTSTVSRSDEAYFSWIAYVNYHTFNDGSWNPTTDGYRLWSHYYKGINQATVFMNHVNECTVIPPEERKSMLAEARFLRAFYYALLIQQYGPVYIWGDADPDLSVKGDDIDRHSLDDNIDFIVEQFDLAAEDLPVSVESSWYGRLTQGAVYAAKSRFLLYMARPLFNGCPWYVGMKNKYGDFLFPQTTDPNKWEEAAKAAKQVIDLNEYELCQKTDNDVLLRGIKSYQAIYFDKWNKELILAKWIPDAYFWNVRCNPSGGKVLKEGYCGFSPSLKLVDAYPMHNSGRFPITGYTNDGKDPVIDPASNYSDVGFTENFRHPIDPPLTGKPVKAHNSCVGRDARFYASILFSGMNWINDWWSTEQQVTFHATGTSPYGTTQGDFTKVGYLFRRMSDPSNNTDAGAGNWGSFSWPLFRLGEIYLNYAEACNEKPNRDETEGFKYWNYVRERSGLNKIETAYPEIIGNKDLYRTLLQKERMVELAFENHRYYDVRTWMIAEKESNGKRYGRNLQATTYEDSWERTDAICTPIVCLPKHHLFPIHQTQLNEMKNITQNYGW